MQMTESARWISVEIKLKLRQGTASSAQLRKALVEYAKQLRRDAVLGTFQDFPPTFFSGIKGVAAIEAANAHKSLDRLFQESAEVDFSGATDENIAAGVVPICLRISAEPFLSPEFGLQHLVGVLAGDLLQRQSTDISASVGAVDLGPLEQTFRTAYRDEGRSHSIHSIRRAFEREESFLLAWSIKPRYGLGSIKGFEPEHFAALIRETANAGVDILELDTRDLRRGSLGELKQLYRLLSRAAVEGGKRRQKPARFSANLSYPAFIAVELARDLAKAHEGDFWIAKVDGGLDGLSTAQAIRRTLQDEKLKQPILTCYPLLNYAGLRSGLGRDAYVEVLALSGIDVIYPGGGPEFARVGSIDPQSGFDAVQRYGRLQERGWPLPTVAGGLHPGQFHVIADLLGPLIAFFVGGGIALHPGGAVKGAAYARTCLDTIYPLLSQPSDWDHPPQVLQRCAAEYGSTVNVPRDEFQYINPKSTFADGAYQRWHDRQT